MFRAQEGRASADLHPLDLDAAAWARPTALSRTALAERGEASDPAERWVEGAAVRQALAALPPRQRAVMVLRYYEDLSEAQIAESLGIARGTVKTLARGALVNLRRLLPAAAPALTLDGGERS